MVKLHADGDYILMLRELTTKNPLLSGIIKTQLKRFQNNPEDTRLDNHSLTKSMAGKWAISVTDDIRIVYKWTGKTTVRILAIGGHEEVY
jgi:mRNA-degrading endonuclease YafQ of YafQ-DinJ toxin-antitoxin module